MNTGLIERLLCFIAIFFVVMFLDAAIFFVGNEIGHTAAGNVTSLQVSFFII